MAEREGFEPPIELPLYRISSAALSTAQPSLRLRRFSVKSSKKASFIFVLRAHLSGKAH